MNDYPIPSRLNLVLVILVVVTLAGLLWAGSAVTGVFPWLTVAAAYALLMNTGYALLHEAEHGLLHKNRSVNAGAGILLGLFFPAPFHLLRQGHIGHHLRNRSDDEAFDLYFEGDNPAWKRLQFYGILTGLFWVVIVLSNLIAAVNPALVRTRKLAFDRPSAALQDSLNPRYDSWIRWEAVGVLGFYSFLLFGVGLSGWSVAGLLVAFGCLWSTLQYVHHYGTVRDVEKGARNLKTFRWLDVLWLNHNWHLNHHLSPTVPWVYLPFLHEGDEFRREGLAKAYWRMWRGPKFTAERVENRYRGKIIR